MPGLVRLELLREQGAQEFEDHPQHGRTNEGEDEQEHQDDSGVNQELNHSQLSFPNRYLAASVGFLCAMAQAMPKARAAIKVTTAAPKSRK